MAVPAAQGVQVALFAATAKLPAGQTSQLADAALENWPATQPAHWVEPAAAAAEPAAHRTQAAAPELGWDLPTRHFWQFVEPVAAWKVPALHGAQAVACSAE